MPSSSRVTCVSGNAALADTERNTRAVLALAGRADVEVAAGRATPLLRPLEITPETHGPHGHRLRGAARARDAPPSRRFGPDLIVEEARRRPGEVTLVTLGPLTNLAIALAAEPALPRLLRRWVGMGGAFRVPGNTTPGQRVERPLRPRGRAASPFGAWQAAVDADATVPRALLLGLDVTERARLTTDDVVALARRAGSRPDDSLDPGRDPLAPERRSVASNPVIRFLADALRFYFEFHARYDGFYGAFVHDPLVVAAALDPGARADGGRRGRRRRLRRPGRRADHRRLAAAQRPAPNADVAVDVDAEAFRRRLIERVGALAAANAGR